MKIISIQNLKQINFTNNKTYSILGASSIPKNQEGEAELLKYMELASEFAKYLVKQNDSILSGCGSKGIMGSAYYSAYENGSIAQNKVIIMQPEWGDEDKEHCSVIDYSRSESERTMKFKNYSDGIFIFPGSCGTLQEVANLIQDNYYSPKNKKPIVLVGKNFFKSIDEQYKYLFNNGYLNKIGSLDELYKIVDTIEELKELTKD